MKYQVIVCENFKETIEVEADTQSDAEELALKQSNFIDPDISDSNEVLELPEAESEH